MTRVLSADTLRCPITGKAAFASREKAEEIIARAYQRPNKTGAEFGRMAKRAYLCDDCGWWHLAASHLREGEAA